jgi:hypothetical protein
MAGLGRHGSEFLRVLRVGSLDADGNTSEPKLALVWIRWHGSRISCIHKVRHDDPTTRILAVGGEDGDGGRWRLTLDEAIAEIDRGQQFLVEEPQGHRVRVVVETSRAGHRYLKTTADGEVPNNLLSLAECPAPAP